MTIGVADRKRDPDNQIGRFPIVGDSFQLTDQHHLGGFRIILQGGNVIVQDLRRLVGVMQVQSIGVF